MKKTTYPFTAIIGQEKMKKALILNAINPQIGGVLIRGEKGTAKSTAVRALANLLPEITAVKGCPFNCNPKSVLCPDCESRENLEVELRRMQVVELPLSATEDKVVGTLDIEHAIKTGEKKFEPGVLARANQNILYVDEVNLLDDHIVDILLDSAAMGVNTVEREGVSYTHPSNFILVGTMNPEEGELRPQFLDRFGLCVDIEGINNIEDRVNIIKQRISFEEAPEEFTDKYSIKEKRLRENIITAKKLLPEVIISEELIELIASICLEVGVDGHRADITTVKTAKTIAAYHGRYMVCEEDIKEAAELVLNHRRRRQPFQEQQREQDIGEIINNHKQQKQNQNTQNNQQGHNSQNSQQDETQRHEEVFDADKPYDIKQSLLQTKENKTKNATGRRSKSMSTRGRYVKSTIPIGKPKDIALVDTLRVAAPKQRSHNSSPVIIIQRQDIREKVRRRKIGNTILFVVDASGSMGANQRMKAVKTAVLSLLLNAYQQRDRVGLIAFRGRDAELLLPPTSSVELAEKYLREIPTGGKTPLPHGLMKAYEVFKTELLRNPDISPLLVLLSDGRANMPLWGNPLEDVEKIGELLRKQRVKSIILDCEHGLVSLGLAKTISQILDAQYILLEEIKTTNILKSIKCSINTSFNP